MTTAALSSRQGRLVLAAFLFVTALYLGLHATVFRNLRLDWDENAVTMSVWSLRHPESFVYSLRDLGIVNDGLRPSRDWSVYLRVMHAWSYIAGTGLNELRALSVLFGLGCLLAVYRLGCAFFSPMAGVLGALFLTLTLPFMEISAIARPETLYILPWFLALLVIVKNRERDAIAPHLLAAGLMAAAVFVYVRAWPGVFGCVAAYLAGRRTKGFRSRGFRVFCAIVAAAVALELARSWRAFAAHPSAQGLYETSATSFLAVVGDRLRWIFDGRYRSYAWLHSVGTVFWNSSFLFSIFSTVWIVSRGNGRNRLFLAILFAQTVPALIGLSAPMVWLPVLAWLSVSTGAAVQEVVRRIRQQPVRLITALLAAGACVLHFYNPLYSGEALFYPVTVLALLSFSDRRRLLLPRNVILLTLAGLLTLAQVPELTFLATSPVQVGKRLLVVAGGLGVIVAAGFLFRREQGYVPSALRTGSLLIFFFIFLSHANQLLFGNAWMPHGVMRQPEIVPVETARFGASENARVLGEDAAWPALRSNPFFGLDSMADFTFHQRIGPALLAQAASVFRPELFVLSESRARVVFGDDRAPEDWFSRSWGVRAVYAGDFFIGNDRFHVHRLSWPPPVQNPS